MFVTHTAQSHPQDDKYDYKQVWLIQLGQRRLSHIGLSALNTVCSWGPDTPSHDSVLGLGQSTGT